MDRQTGRRLVQRLLPPCRHLRRERFLRHIDLLVRISALFRGLERHEPMHVRVREVQDQLALLALATPFPDLTPGLFTRGPVPAITPAAAFRLPGDPQIGALAATGRRRWRLPAGFGSPHGRTGGVLAWPESSQGQKIGGMWKT